MIAEIPKRKVTRVYNRFAEWLCISEINLWEDWQHSSGDVDQFKGVKKTLIRNFFRDPEDGQPFVIGGSRECWIVRYRKSSDRFIVIGDYDKDRDVSVITGYSWVIPLRMK